MNKNVPKNSQNIAISAKFHETVKLIVWRGPNQNFFSIKYPVTCINRLFVTFSLCMRQGTCATKHHFPCVFTTNLCTLYLLHNISSMTTQSTDL